MQLIDMETRFAFYVVAFCVLKLCFSVSHVCVLRFECSLFLRFVLCILEFSVLVVFCVLCFMVILHFCVLRFKTHLLTITSLRFSGLRLVFCLTSLVGAMFIIMCCCGNYVYENHVYKSHVSESHVDENLVYDNHVYERLRVLDIWDIGFTVYEGLGLGLGAESSQRQRRLARQARQQQQQDDHGQHQQQQQQHERPTTSSSSMAGGSGTQ